MSFLKQPDRYFEPRKDYGAIFLRLLIGLRLIDGTQDNVFSWARMIEFRDFLEHHGVAYPLLAAQVSVYAQFICGILILVGAFIRMAAGIMIINFIAAMWIAHQGNTFQEAFAPLTMLFCSAFFLFYGAGRISVDQWRLQQKKM